MGTLKTVKRAALLPLRYGMGSAAIEKRLKSMGTLLQRWGLKPTVPTTGSVLKLHPSIRRILADFDVAIHGYRHVAYSDLSMETVALELESALEAFRDANLPVNGFRAPYLRPNPEMFPLLARKGLVFDSSTTAFVLPQEDPAAATAWKLAMRRYGSSRGEPHTKAVCSGLVELPVSLPDDEILVDAMSIRQPSTLSRIFESMLGQIRIRGALFVIQVHPERFSFFQDALIQVLTRAAEDSAWMATLSEIANHVAKSGMHNGWPGASPYAISVTGDLDAVSVGDFATRFLGA